MAMKEMAIMCAQNAFPMLHRNTVVLAGAATLDVSPVLTQVAVWQEVLQVVMLRYFRAHFVKKGATEVAK